METEPTTLDKLDPETPTAMLATVLYELQCMNAKLSAITIFMNRAMPLLEKAETMLANTPTQRLMKILRPGT